MLAVIFGSRVSETHFQEKPRGESDQRPRIERENFHSLSKMIASETNIQTEHQLNATTSSIPSSGHLQRSILSRMKRLPLQAQPSNRNLISETSFEDLDADGYGDTDNNNKQTNQGESRGEREQEIRDSDKEISGQQDAGEQQWQVNGACWSNQSSISAEANVSSATSRARVETCDSIEQRDVEIADPAASQQLDGTLLTPETKAATATTTPITTTTTTTTTAQIASKKRLRSATKILAFFSRRLNKSSENAPTGSSDGGTSANPSAARRAKVSVSASSIVKFSRQETTDSLATSAAGYLSDGTMTSSDEGAATGGGGGASSSVRQLPRQPPAPSGARLSLSSRLRNGGLASRLFASRSTHSLWAGVSGSGPVGGGNTDQTLVSAAPSQTGGALATASDSTTNQEQQQQQQQQQQEQPAFIVPKVNTLKLPIVCCIRSVDGKLMREIFVNRYELGEYLVENLKVSLNVLDTKYFGLKLAKSLDEQDDQRQPWLDLNERVYKQIKNFAAAAASSRAYDPQGSRSLQNISSSSRMSSSLSFPNRRSTMGTRLSKLGSSISSATRSNSTLASPTTCRSVDIYLRIKFYPPNLTRVQDPFLRQYLWLQLRRDLRVGKLTSSVNNLTMLMALILQHDLGDYKPEFVSSRLPQIGIMPNQDLIEDQAVKIWSGKLRSLKQHQAQMQFLRTAVILETYGFDYWQVRDHQRQRDYLLGYNYAGVKTIRNGRIVNHFRWHNISKIAYERRMIIFHTYADENSKRKQILGFKCLSNDECHNLYMRLLEQKYFFTVDLAYFDKSTVRRPSYLQASVEVASQASAGSDEAQNAEIRRILSSANSRRTSCGTNEDGELEADDDDDDDDDDGQEDDGVSLAATAAKSSERPTGQSARQPAASGKPNATNADELTTTTTTTSTDNCDDNERIERAQQRVASSSSSGQHSEARNNNHLRAGEPSGSLNVAPPATQYNCQDCYSYPNVTLPTRSASRTAGEIYEHRYRQQQQQRNQQLCCQFAKLTGSETTPRGEPQMAAPPIDSSFCAPNEIYSQTFDQSAATCHVTTTTPQPEGSIGQPDCAFCVGLTGGPAYQQWPPEEAQKRAATDWRSPFSFNGAIPTASDGQQQQQRQVAASAAGDTLCHLAETILTEPANVQLRARGENFQRQAPQQQQQHNNNHQSDDHSPFTIHSAVRVLIVILVMNFLLRLTDGLSSVLIDLLTTSAAAATTSEAGDKLASMDELS